MRRNDQLLALFVRWVNGNLWVDDDIYMKKKFHQLVNDVKQIIDLEEQNILIDTKMLEQLTSIGQCVNGALKKAKLPIEIEPYSPEFDHIGAELQQICVLFVTNKLKIDVAANAWHKCCAEFFEEMWHQWFYKHGIYTKSASELEPDKDSNKDDSDEDDSDEDEDKKPLLNFNVKPTEQMLIDVFEALINECNWGELKRQKLSIIYKIGNVLERALHDDPIKTLNTMHNCEGYGPKMMEMVKYFCDKDYNLTWTTNAWHQICGVFIWDNWLFNYEMLTVSDMRIFHDQILALFGSGTKEESKNGNSSIKMHVVDSSVLNIIGQILMEKVLIDQSGKTLIHFVNSGYSAICNFCANRTAQFSGWEHICVYNLWLFVCNELDPKAVGDFLRILRRMDKIRSIIGIESADWLPQKSKWRLLDEIGTQLQQNMRNPMNLKNFKALLVQTWPNLSIFCSIVAKKIETKYGTFFPSWIKVCRAMSALTDMEKAKNNNKTPRKGKIQKENKKEVLSTQKEDSKKKRR
ncbi:hypothetical protein niasHT_023656 [Heterodera trifolii]|uniref:Uncharacterized protein n=1 Tax=Heterodera trifolii TaxID=157864 RepID=A0ABD2JUZ3_9BILA